MATRLIILTVAILLLAGCPAKKPKPDEGANGAATGTEQDTNIKNQNLSFDVTGSDSGKIDGLYTIHFDYDKSNLTSEARSLLAKDASWVKSHEGSKLQIEGHCDRHGSIEYNLALGERRAKTVRKYLENLGVKGARLSTISYGKEKPLDPSETDSADAKNRRANFVVQGQ